MKTVDISNKKFGKLLAVKRCTNMSGKTAWECKCDCGNITFVTTSNLTCNRIRSCGCLKIKQLLERSTTHNQRHTVLYSVWRGLRQRCNNPKHASYHNYGGRGITVCEEWDKSFQAFYDWSYANGYSTENQKNEKLKLTIDRIDNNGNYEPSNCRWVDRKTQTRNMRTTRFITFNGQNKSVSEWCEIYGIKLQTFNTRIRNGWSIEEALTKPIGSKKSK
jgi:hypothetical protein